MGLGELLEIHRDCKQFHCIVNNLNYGFRSFSYSERKMLEAYSILEKLEGKIPEKKMQAMKGAMCLIEAKFENDWLSGALG